MDAHNVQRDFRKAMYAAGLIGMVWTPRELRQSFVSQFDERMPLEVMSRLVGHRSTAVTETIHRKQLRPVIEGGVDAMGRIFPSSPPSERSHSVSHSRAADPQPVTHISVPPSVCLRSLPVWLPKIWLAALMAEVCIRDGRTCRAPLLTIAASPDQHVACIVAAVIRRAESKLSGAIQTDATNTRIHN
jgi:hypothetical protein